MLLDNISKSITNNKKGNKEVMGGNLTSLENIILTKIRNNPMILNELLFALKDDKSDILETISIMELKNTK